MLEAADLSGGSALPPSDLVIDAAYGTGLERPYSPPQPGRAPVLAVDIPSGLSGLTGEVLNGGGALSAVATITFASFKPGLLLAAGPTLAGDIEVADIGLGPLVDAAATCWLVEDGDVRLYAPAPASRGPQVDDRRTGSGRVTGDDGCTMVRQPGRLSVPAPATSGCRCPVWRPTVSCRPARWCTCPCRRRDGTARCSKTCRGSKHWLSARAWPAASAGGEPGLPGGEVGALVAAAPVPVVIDADGLNAIGTLEALRDIVARRSLPTVITPHAGELTRLAGQPPGADRVASVREAASRSGAIVLLKGSTTVIASPRASRVRQASPVLISAAGDSRLATAGTGDVLSGVIGAFIARGVPAFEAAALGAHVHGRAAGDGYAEGLVAGRPARPGGRLAVQEPHEMTRQGPTYTSAVAVGRTPPGSFDAGSFDRGSLFGTAEEVHSPGGNGQTGGNGAANKHIAGAGTRRARSASRVAQAGLGGGGPGRGDGQRRADPKSSGSSGRLRSREGRRLWARCRPGGVCGRGWRGHPPGRGAGRGGPPAARGGYRRPRPDPLRAARRGHATGGRGQPDAGHLHRRRADLVAAGPGVGRSFRLEGSVPEVLAVWLPSRSTSRSIPGCTVSGPAPRVPSSWPVPLPPTHDSTSRACSPTSPWPTSQAARFTRQQLARFERVVATWTADGIRPPLLHAANSAGALAHPRSRYQMVRPGIAVYGLAPAASLEDEPSVRALTPALSLRARVSYVKEVAAGEAVSYGLALLPPGGLRCGHCARSGTPMAYPAVCPRSGARS